jgi:Cu-Zn family superoxide dismutase
MDWSRIAAACLVVAVPSLTLAEAPVTASADFKGCGETKVTGTATLKEQVTAEGVKEVTVDLKVQGLADGKHAVHIHEVGKCEPCAAAGGHHDPGPFGQSRPDTAAETTPATDINHPFHMGDLINLEVKNGTGTLRHTTNRVTLSPGRLSVFDADGSSIIVHTQADTYCDEETDLKKGCAGGAREACAILKPATR